MKYTLEILQMDAMDEALEEAYYCISFEKTANFSAKMMLKQIHGWISEGFFGKKSPFSQLNNSSLSQWTLKKKVWTLFSLLNM